MNRKCFPAALVSLAMVVAISAAAQDPTPSAERGQQTFMRVGCYQCHGSDGQGNGAAPALTPNTLPAIAIASFIRYSAGQMPVYPQEVLSDEEIADIVAYLQAVPPPPSADSIELLQNLKRAN